MVLLPSGISFYTFVALSYVIDVYNGDAKQAPTFGAFSCFLGLYPHLIAGPIIRYQTVANQLMERTHTVEKFSSGTAIFMLGFAKKILLADSSAGIADAVFGADAPGMLNAWWGVLAYSFQIYFDFCGYSDMAVGLARMLGIEFPKNFNAPVSFEKHHDILETVAHHAVIVHHGLSLHRFAGRQQARQGTHLFQL